MKEAFKAWAKGEGLLLRRVVSDERYESMETEWAWRAWRTAPALKKTALQRIAELLEDGDGPDLEDLLHDDTKVPRLTQSEREQLAVIVRWARLPSGDDPRLWSARWLFDQHWITYEDLQRVKAALGVTVTGEKHG